MDGIQIESDDLRWSAELAAGLRTHGRESAAPAEGPPGEVVWVLDEPDPERCSLRGCIVLSPPANRALLAAAARQSAAAVLPKIPDIEALAILIAMAARRIREHRRLREQLARLGALLATVSESHRRLRVLQQEATS